MAAALAVTALGVIIPQQASASEVGVQYALRTEYSGMQVQADNEPGNGSASWIWAYNGTGTDDAWAEYQYYDGRTGKLWPAQWTSYSANLSADIWRFHACVERDNHNGGTIVYCGGWVYFG
ncbi:hypothetical protein ACWERY_10905 [Streptomyces sp. NPDC004082]|uniref:hypothetical protein n=1 Tax=unclassified Streptomyces TaxID=2593676 RepID=UPI0033BAD5D7